MKKAILVAIPMLVFAVSAAEAQTVQLPANVLEGIRQVIFSIGLTLEQAQQIHMQERAIIDQSFADIQTMIATTQALKTSPMNTFAERQAVISQLQGMTQKVSSINAQLGAIRQAQAQRAIILQKVEDALVKLSDILKGVSS
ncbi:MAG: hypothetical protein HYS52_00680 [Candidatus Wildermuthbacteria bacterium]|nr:hypothetical protein [Candidatus Wildermuthbacteria bacterium]